MESLIRFDPTEAEPSLIFDCGDLPVDDVLLAADIEPNGYFWEGVLRFLAPPLSADIEFDSEADMFCIYGDAQLLVQARGHLEPYLTDPTAIARLIEEAQAAGFDLEDSEPEPSGERKSFFGRLWRRRGIMEG